MRESVSIEYRVSCEYWMRLTRGFIAGFSVNKDIPTYKVEDPKKVLTIEEMNS